jgi:hypothetical protein
MPNIYGVQKIPETEVRSGLDVAVTSSSAAAQGAKAGQAILPGPAGIIGGALVGGAMGYFGGKKQKTLEERRRGQEEEYNKFVTSLEGRAAPNTTYVPTQARYGMRNKYQEGAEIEGDGSGDIVNGIGEVHVDENYNIKNVAVGAPKHEEGGVDLPDNGDSSLNGGDIIFPWQNDKAKYEKGMRMINRYKFNGDVRAKEWLDAERDRLPTDEDYKVEGKYANGRKPSMQDYFNSPDMFFQGIVPTESENLASLPKANKTDNEGRPVIVPDTNTGASVTNGQENRYKSVQPDYKYVMDKGDGYQYRYDPANNHLSVRREGETEWRTDEESWGRQHKGKPGELTNMQKAIENLGFSSSVPEDNTGIVNRDVISPIDIKERERTSMLEESPWDRDIDLFETKEFSEFPESPKKQKKEKKEKKEKKTDFTQIRTRTAPLKYANILHNLAKGTEAAEKTYRRFTTPEQLDYRDMSAAQRRAVREQRNAEQQMLRGKGLTAGQQQSYLSQAGGRYAGRMEDINEREAQRASAVDQYNVAQRARAGEMNLNLARQYDVEDAQNRAARQRYLDTAFAETSTLAGIEEQADYMRDKDRRMFDIQEKTIPLIGTKDFQYSADNWNQPVWGKQPAVDTRLGSGEALPEGAQIMQGGRRYTKVNGKWEVQ